MALRWLAGVLAGLLLPGVGAATAQDRRSPDVALHELMQDARASCAQQGADRLVRILCGKRIRFGVRDFYPLFATREGETHQGYEVDVARALAERLGVEIELTRVNAASRIPLLAEDLIDVTIATMGHNTQRDGQVHFIRPHYYRSETILVGPRALAAAGWRDVAGRTICVTIGNGSNAELVSHGARLMLFEEAGQLPERLRSEVCQFAAQDDSFFAAYFAQPDFAAAYAAKFGFAQVPWGMAVARTGSNQLAQALDILSLIFHRDGVFLEIARKHRIGTAFLEQQKAAWQRPDCTAASGTPVPACLLPALDTEMRPTGFVGAVDAVETFFEKRLGIDIDLPMFRTESAWSLLQNGIVNTLILIVGALAATLGVAMLFGAAMASHSKLVRWPARAATVALQSSPIVLTLVIAATLAHALFPYSSVVAIGAAILALGFANGSNAGQAVSEAMISLRAEMGGDRPGLFQDALGRAATQIVAFLINAAKGTPIASFIGAPELLSALTDITSFASGRVTTYCMLLVFYTVVVMGVVWLCNRLRDALERRLASRAEKAAC